MMQDQAKWIISTGILVTLAGLMLYFFGKYLHWIGRLPGDIRIERENFSFYFPVTTMILLSLLVSGLMRLVQYFMK